MHTIAVSGASGQLGRLVLGVLAAQSNGPVVALSRTPHGANARFADFEDPTSLQSAFEGVDRLLLISTDALGRGGRRVRQHRAAIDAAAVAGVRHIVYTSILHATSSPLTSVAADHVATEAILQDSAVSYTLLRNAFYDDLARRIVSRADAGGKMPHAAGTGGVAYVSRADCAAAAAAALTDCFGGRRLLGITGPEVVDMRALADLAGLEALALGPDALRQRLVEAGTPPPLASFMSMIDAGIAEGAMSPASDDFKRLVGRPPAALKL